MQSTMIRRYAPWIQAACVAAILAATMLPSDDAGLRGFFCLLCAERAVSGFLLNMLLFVPLGFIMAWCGWRTSRVALLGAGLSAFIETAQLFIPGRETALVDLLSNTAGAAVGAMLWITAREVLDAPPERRVRLARGATVLALLAQVFVAMLVPTALPHSDYYGQWTPDFLGLVRYQGAIRSATIGGIAIEKGRLPQSPRVRELLLRGDHLDLAVTAGAPPAGESVLFSIADEHTTFIVIILIRDGNVILRHHGVADLLRLTPTEVRIPGTVLAFQPGDAFAVSAWMDGQRWCLVVGRAQACDLVTAGSLWRFFMPGLSPPSALLDALCMACLFLPLGFYLVRAPGLLLAAAPMAVLPLLPAGIEFSIAPVVGAAAGLIVGRLLHVARTRRSLREGTRPA